MLLENEIKATQKSTNISLKDIKSILYGIPPGIKRSCDIAATSQCTSQRLRRYVSNETPNDVSMERRQDVSVVRLDDLLSERHNDVSKGRSNDAPSLRLQDVSNKP